MKIDTRTTTSKIRLCHLSKNELEMQESNLYIRVYVHTWAFSDHKKIKWKSLNLLYSGQYSNVRSVYPLHSPQRSALPPQLDKMGNSTF